MSINRLQALTLSKRNSTRARAVAELESVYQLIRRSASNGLTSCRAYLSKLPQAAIDAIIADLEEAQFTVTVEVVNKETNLLVDWSE